MGNHVVHNEPIYSHKYQHDGHGYFTLAKVNGGYHDFRENVILREKT